MKLLVTGGTGFLGAALVERLLARGETDVRCLVRSGSPRAKLEALARGPKGAAIELYPGSLDSADAAAKALEGVDVVYHLAASLAGAPADMFLNIVVASKHLLDAIVRAGRPIKVVLVSSFGVYGTAGLPRGAVIDEATPMEAHPERRDVYSHAKLRQEKLFREYAEKHGVPLVVLRPGVIYGRGGSRLSARVGLDLAGLFLALGGKNLLPLTYVESCADAIVVAGQNPSTVGQTYNVVDDDLVTADDYLARYVRDVQPLHVLHVPYPALRALSSAVLAYSTWSKGQLPAIFTPYKTRTMWKGTRFTNAKLKGLGWRPLVPTTEGLGRAFAFHKAALAP